MENFEQIIRQFDLSLKEVRVGKGKGVGILGNSGIGKTYAAELFFSENEDIFLFSMKGLPIAQSAYTSLYDGIYGAIEKSEIRKETLLNLLKKYTRLLPGFGKYIAPLFDISAREGLADIISKSGLAVGLSPAPHIIRFISEIANHKPVVFFCDDSQWIDPESWSCVAYIAENLPRIPWLVILIFNDRVETWTTPIFERLGVIDRWRLKAADIGWTVFSAQPWCPLKLPMLCERILEKPCQLSAEHFSELYRLSGGIPLYLRSILDFLKENAYLELKENRYWPTRDWDKLDIGSNLHDSIVLRLKQVYHEIPNSREPLEVASVMGSPFIDKTIDALLNICNSFQLLSDIEKRSLLVQYFLEKRYWVFQHNQVRNVIYKSLGNELSQSLHQKVGEYLENSEPENHLTIAYHFEMAKEWRKEVEHRIRETENLINQSLFNSALLLTNQIEERLSTNLLLFSAEEQATVNLLRGKCLFHLVKYYEAISMLSRIDVSQCSPIVSGAIYRWLGRCYMKLNSQEDFERSLSYLNDAVTILARENMQSELGPVYSDLVVTLAHLNRFTEAESAFKKAEGAFSKAKDIVGMARLQRRNVIFMESTLSAPILLQVANTFKTLNIPHEHVMALNNAATEYLYLDEYNKACQLLETALEESTEIGDFGQVYLYNNLCLASFMLNDLKKARQSIDLARDCRQREVEQLIVDINETVLIGNSQGIVVALPMIERVFKNAMQVGELAYITPASINLAWAYLNIGAPEKALEKLDLVIPEKQMSNSAYTICHWFRLKERCYQVLQQDELLASFRKSYSRSCNIASRKYNLTDFCFVDMQFWGD